MFDVKSNNVLSAGKMIPTVYLAFQNIMIDYLKEGKTINGVFMHHCWTFKFGKQKTHKSTNRFFQY